MVILIDDGTRAEINSIVDRIHKDLKIGDQPIVLAEIRDLLELDLRYYSSSDPSLLESVIHKLKVGGKQIIRRPSLLLDIVKKFDLSALFVPDQKRILLDADIPDLKKRWNETHEIAHSVLPWHDGYLMGDKSSTLSPSCHRLIEAEANYATGRILFPHKRFVEIAGSAQPSIPHVRNIARQFGNTITSALWRFVESSNSPCAAIVGGHPLREEKEAVAHFIQSPKFSRQFSNVSAAELLVSLRQYCSYRDRGPLGTGECRVIDVNGDAHIFFMESFGNSHQVLSLIHYAAPSALHLAVGRAA